MQVSKPCPALVFFNAPTHHVTFFQVQERNTGLGKLFWDNIRSTFKNYYSIVLNRRKWLRKLVLRSRLQRTHYPGRRPSKDAQENTRRGSVF